MKKTLITMEAVSKVFYSEDIETHALSNVSLSISEGEYVSITGPSGCGKSTMLSIMGLLDTATTGRYLLASHIVTELNTRQRTQIRNRDIGFIFQSFNLISDMSVKENVELPLRYRSDINKQVREKRVITALDQVGMTHRKNHFPSQLSGGQQQRVAIARAIAGKPSMILADEPTGNLDSKNALLVLDLLDELHKNGSTIIIVTHDLDSAARAQHRIQMLDGKIISDDINNMGSSKIEEPKQNRGIYSRSDMMNI